MESLSCDYDDKVLVLMFFISHNPLKHKKKKEKQELFH